MTASGGICWPLERRWSLTAAKLIIDLRFQYHAVIDHRGDPVEQLALGSEFRGSGRRPAGSTQTAASSGRGRWQSEDAFEIIHDLQGLTEVGEYPRMADAKESAGFGSDTRQAVEFQLHEYTRVLASGAVAQ